MADQPTCNGCGKPIASGEGYYDKAFDLYFHFEKVNIDTMPVGSTIHIDTGAVVTKQGKTMSGACAMAYIMKSDKSYQFHSENIVPVEKLDDLQQG